MKPRELELSGILEITGFERGGRLSGLNMVFWNGALVETFYGPIIIGGGEEPPLDALVEGERVSPEEAWDRLYSRLESCEAHAVKLSLACVEGRGPMLHYHFFGRRCSPRMLTFAPQVTVLVTLGALFVPSAGSMEEAVRLLEERLGRRLISYHGVVRPDGVQLYLNLVDAKELLSMEERFIEPLGSPLSVLRAEAILTSKGCMVRRNRTGFTSNPT